MTNRRRLRPWLNRRRFLAGSGGLLAGAALAACDLSTDPQGGDAGGNDGSGDNPPEAPELAELVEQGELPPVEERLPAEPVVIEPIDRVGVYGGTWNTAMTGTADRNWLWRNAGYDHLIRVNYETLEIEPNLAAEMEVSDDGTVFTFHLREGVKWSDGEPFTAADVEFWYEAFLMNEDLSPGGPPSWMVTNEEPGVVEAVDDLTVTFTFTGGPNGFLPYRLGAYDGRIPTSMPKHYLGQFHPDYADGDVDELVAAEGHESWMDLFMHKAGEATDFMQAGNPTINPWMLTTELGESSRLVYERNPYYWKVDPEGSQLPYIDRIVFEVVEDTEVILLKASNGEFGLHSRHINFPTNKPVLADAREQGNFRFYDLAPGSMNVGVVALNLTHQDPVKREIFQNKDFRIGLSYAIDRQEVIDSVYQRQGEPWQGAPRPECRFFDEELAKQHSEYDVDLANEYLDRAGYSERDADGFRLGPDGNRISVNFIATIGGGSLEALLVDVEEMIKDYWGDVGIDVGVQAVERSLYQNRTSTDDHDALMWTGWGGDDLTVIIDPRFYLPFATEQHNFAGQWAQWYFSNGADGEEPPEATRRQMELYRQVLATPDPEERDDLFRELLAIAKEEFYVFGISLATDGYGIVANNFHNVHERPPSAWPYPEAVRSPTEQYFIAD